MSVQPGGQPSLQDIRGLYKELDGVDGDEIERKILGLFLQTRNALFNEEGHSINVKELEQEYQNLQDTIQSFSHLPFNIGEAITLLSQKKDLESQGEETAQIDQKIEQLAQKLTEIETPQMPHKGINDDNDEKGSVQGSVQGNFGKKRNILSAYNTMISNQLTKLLQEGGPVEMKKDPSHAVEAPSHAVNQPPDQGAVVVSVAQQGRREQQNQGREIQGRRSNNDCYRNCCLAGACIPIILALVYVLALFISKQTDSDLPVNL